MDPRLKGAIGTPRIQSLAGELVRLALTALEDLKQLDESLYERFLEARTSGSDAAKTEAGLRKLWNETFGGLEPLLVFCRSLDQKDLDQDTIAESPEDVDPFDFGDLEAGPASSELELGASDIGSLLGAIDEHVHDDEHRWQTVVEKVGSIEYGLRSQLADARSRMDISLAAGEINQVLGILDDTQSSASEGVHALVSAVYEAFVPAVDPATVVPGYLTSLGRALLVRRGLAQLATTLGPNNDVLQNPEEAERHDQVLATIRDVMLHFVGNVVCRAMRAADRYQMVEFQQQLAEQKLTVARLTSEGLVKYLESLRSINQREVLVIHDQRALENVREALSNARQLIDISPRTTQEMLDKAHSEAQRLRGRSPATDQLLLHLERYAPRMPMQQLLEALENVLQQAG